MALNRRAPWAHGVCLVNAAAVHSKEPWGFRGRQEMLPKWKTGSWARLEHGR